jgi:Zn-dependent M28 family amino/carboxypeptidase
MRQRFATSALFVLAFVLIFVPAATTAVGVDSTAYRNAVTATEMQAHLQQFQNFGQASVPAFGHPTRVDGSLGFTQSVDYVAQQMTAAGYQVHVQPFTFDRFEETAPPVFQRLTPTQQTYANGTDFQTMDYSGSGTITNARLVATGGIVIPSPGGSTSGCTAADFNGFPAGAVALIQRGTCTFREKATNAKNAGAVGVVIFNEGNVDPDDDRLGVIFGTLDPPQFDRPVIGTTFAAGRDLYNLLQSGAEVRVNLSVTARVVPTQSANVIADTVGGRADRTVVVGAHLDSVDAGPGINDNGSGSAMLLELAKQLSNLNITPTNKVRFAWWGGEEFGLLGAEHYVSTLPKAELKNIALNLNYDMVASPNWVRFVYDGDGSATDTKGPSGSGAIEQAFLDYFASQGLATEPTAFDGRSDYGPFIDRGIPAGGLFTGAEGIKTAAEAATYGGTAGAPYDPCYHQLCDQWPANIDLKVLDQMGDAAADVLLQFAMSTSSPNGTNNASGNAQASTEFKGSKLRK